MKPLKQLTTFVLLCLFLCTGHAFSQSSLFSFEKFISKDGDTLNYRQLQSDYDSNSKYPLVIFLHGSGERGNDNEAQLKWGVKNFASDRIMKTYKPIVIAPQCPSNMTWGNFSKEDVSLLPDPSKPMELLIELIQKLIDDLSVDTDRIYITGLSMGGFGTFDAIARYPDLFAAAVPVCGGGDPSKAQQIAHIPLWIFHGAKDTAVHPIYSLKMLQMLNEAGVYPGFTLYPEAGHFSWIAAYSDAMMMDWLFKQRKQK
jgi:predicted peptidase